MAFRKLSDGSVVLFYVIDIPLYSQQVELVMAELQESTQSLKPQTKQGRLRNKWWKYFEGMTHDSYGSFRLDFEEEILDYDKDTLASINEDIFCLLNETKFMSNVMTWQSIQNDIDEYVESYDTAEAVLELYLDCSFASGYSVLQTEIEDIFCNYGKVLSFEAVSEKFLMLALAGKNVVLKETKQVA